MNGNEKEDLSRKGLRNIENSSVERNKWQSTKQKMLDHLKDKGYKLDTADSESKWLAALKREFQTPRFMYGGIRSGLRDNTTLYKDYQSISKKFSPQELNRIDEYINKVDSDLFRRTEFSKMPTIGEANPHAIPDSVIRASRQEWFKKLDDYFAAWDVLLAFGGAVAGVAATGKTRAYIRGTEPRSGRSPRERIAYGHTEPDKPVEEASTSGRVVEPVVKPTVAEPATKGIFPIPYKKISPKSEAPTLADAIETGKEVRIEVNKGILKKNLDTPKRPETAGTRAEKEPEPEFMQSLPQSKAIAPERPEAAGTLGTTTQEKIQLSFETNFTGDQIKNWKANNFWKTPEELSSMRGKPGFYVVTDKKTNQVIAAYWDNSEKELIPTGSARAEGFAKLFDAKFNMVVRPDMEGKGIGTEIFRKMIEKAKSLGADYIRVNAATPSSFEWFEKYGQLKSGSEGAPGKRTGTLVFKTKDLEKKLSSKKGSLVETRVEPNERPRVEAKPAAGEVRPETIELAFYSVENDPTLQDFRKNRGCTTEEFGNWLRNLPDETKVKFQQRLEQGGRIKKFVLEHAAHDVRVSRDLKLMGINQEHEDFVGPNGKADERIAEKLSSSKSWTEDKGIEKAKNDHNEDRPHHNPLKADDYLHQALDVYDAVTDPARDYKTKWTTEQITERIVNGEKTTPKAKEAMKAVLEWKAKGDGEELGKKIRQEYNEKFKTLPDKAETSTKIERTQGDLRIREKGSQQNIGDRRERIKQRFA